MMKKICRTALATMLGLGMLATAATSFAGVQKVICVPWQGDVAKFHTAITGESVQLKAVIKTDATTTIWYKWSFGDGSESAVTTLSGSLKYNVAVNHTYVGADGTPITAQLLVSHVDSSMATSVADNYLIQIQDAGADARANVAIDRGLWYLYTHQLNSANVQSIIGEPVTAWASFSSSYPSATAVAIQAFEINNHKEVGNYDEDPYAEVVNQGLNWLLAGRYGSTSILNSLAVGPQVYGHPEDYDNDGTADGNGIGVQVYYSGHPCYQGGMVMDAIISSGTPGADSGRDFDSDGLTDTYVEVIRDMVDAYSWGQIDNNSTGYYGSWRYNWNSGPIDNSAAQWAAIGLIPAEQQWGQAIPQFVKDRNKLALTDTYKATPRYFTYYGNTLVRGTAAVTRPSGMVQMYLSWPGYQADEKWTGPLSWYRDNFDLAFSTGQRSYYGWLSFVKAMRLSGTDAFDNGFNWYYGDAATLGLSQRLVNEQEADGSWPQGGQVSHPGYYGETFVTGWAIQMLKPALFASAPIACFTADPNPTFENAVISFDPSCSDHSDSAKDRSNLTTYEWDWDNDGIFDQSTTDPSTLTHSYNCGGNPLPCTHPVTLRVTDDSNPALNASMQLDVRLTDPPHPPIADANGPYTVSMCNNDSLTLDGTGSFDPNQGLHQSGCVGCPDDQITAWNWDFVAPLNDFTNEAGETVTLGSAAVGSYFGAGSNAIGLQVTDNTALSFPDSGDPNLTDADFSSVEVNDGCYCDLTAYAKARSASDAKIQLTWSHDGSASYDIYRSTTGPNSGFSLLADDYVTTYAVYIDYNVSIGTTYWYRVENNNQCGSTAASATPSVRVRRRR